MRAPRSTILLLLIPAACGPSAPGATTPVAQPPRAGAVERYFPLEEGKVYAYATDEGGETGMLVARVHRTDATHGELRMSNTTKRFVVSPDAVAYDDGRVILKAPLDVGASWPGEHGGTTKSYGAPVNIQ